MELRLSTELAALRWRTQDFQRDHWHWLAPSDLLPVAWVWHSRMAKRQVLVWSSAPLATVSLLQTGLLPSSELGLLAQLPAELRSAALRPELWVRRTDWLRE